MSKISFGISEASLIHAPVSSSDRSLPVSVGLSSAMNMTSSSIAVPSPMLLILIVEVIGVSHLMGATFAGNQVSQVLIVVDFSSG